MNFYWALPHRFGFHSFKSPYDAFMTPHRLRKKKSFEYFSSTKRITTFTCKYLTFDANFEHIYNLFLK